MFKIAKKIAIPPIAKAYEYEETLRAMETGDSFLMPEGANRTSPYVVAKRLNMQVIIRKQEDGFYRCWRIA
jgi:hypothetical protein